jgi:hypothetical protein
LHLLHLPLLLCHCCPLLALLHGCKLLAVCCCSVDCGAAGSCLLRAANLKHPPGIKAGQRQLWVWLVFGSTSAATHLFQSSKVHGLLRCRRRLWHSGL